MMKFIKEIVRFIVFIGLVAAALLVVQKFILHPESATAPISQAPQLPLDKKSEELKKYLTSIDKPQRIEFSNLSQRFAKEIQNFKTLKIPQDKNSTFYLTIMFFTDEGDPSAPLVAQIRYVDIKSGNTIKEESLNLE